MLAPASFKSISDREARQQRSNKACWGSRPYDRGGNLGGANLSGKRADAAFV